MRELGTKAQETGRFFNRLTMLRPSVIYRFVLNLFLIWLVLLAVFLALPSPIFEDDGTNFATAVLRSGKRLTRAYETGEYYPRIYGETYSAVLRAHEANKEWFMLDFQLVAGETAVMVHDQLSVALTPPDSPREKISDPFVVDGRAGNVDGLLGLHPPWFQTADAVELAWQVQQSSAYLTLRTRWVDDSTVELWPDAQSWSGNETDNTPQPPQGWNNVDIQPMITIHTKAGKFASATTPHPPLSLSPTSTLRMRSYLLALLAPSAWLVYTTFAIIGMAVGTLTSLLTFAIIVTLLLYVVWVGMNRPSYDEYVERLKEKWADGVAYVRPLAPWRRRALSIRDGADVEKAHEEGKPFPV